jgi:ribosomal-protein-alanine N-acetyltransferase
MIRVRRARSEDVPQLIEIARTSVTAAHWTQEAYARLVAVEGSRSPVGLVVEEDGCVEGFLVGREVGAGDWEIENIAVHGPARRRGLGTRLLGEFLEAVRSRGGNDVYLEVRQSNRAARTLYEKWGFLESGVRKAYYQSPEEDALILRFSFPQGG